MDVTSVEESRPCDLLAVIFRAMRFAYMFRIRSFSAQIIFRENSSDLSYDYCRLLYQSINQSIKHSCANMDGAVVELSMLMML